MEKRTFSFTLDEGQLNFLNRLLGSADIKGQEVGFFTNLMGAIQKGVNETLEAEKAAQFEEGPAFQE